MKVKREEKSQAWNRENKWELSMGDREQAPVVSTTTRRARGGGGDEDEQMGGLTSFLLHLWQVQSSGAL